MLVVFEVCVSSLALVVALVSLLLSLCWCSSRRGPNPTEHDAEALIDDPIRPGVDVSFRFEQWGVESS